MALENKSKENAIFREVNTFFLDQKLCDITLIAENDGFKVNAHKVILSASSKNFEVMFSGAFREAEAKEVKLQEIDGDTLNSIINYIYSGSIDLTTDTVEEILKSAHLFEIKSLERICCDFLSKQMDLFNLLGIALFAERYSYPELYKNAESLVCRNFMHICKEEEFFLLEADQLGKFLSNDDLCVPSEEDVFNSIMSWVEHDKDNRKQFIEQLLKHIRFPLLTPQFIATKVEEHCKSPESKQLVSDAFKWHSLLEGESRVFPQDYIKPRNHQNVTIAITGWNSEENEFHIGYYYRNSKDWIYKKCPGPVEKRTYFGSAMLENSLYITGGLSDTKKELNCVGCLDLRSLVWKEIPPLEVKRCVSKAIAFKNELYVIGGYSERTLCTSLEKYDSKSRKWQQITTFPNEMRISCIGTHPSTICISSYRNNKSDLSFYDPIFNIWTETWLTFNDEVFGIGTIKKDSVDHFIVVTEKSFIKYNLSKNSKETVEIDWLNDDYKFCKISGNRVIFYGKTKIKEYFPFRNDWEELPNLKNQNPYLPLLFI